MDQPLQAPFSSVLNSCSPRADTYPLAHSHPQTHTHNSSGHLFTPTHTCPHSPAAVWFGQLLSEHIGELRASALESFLSKVAHCFTEAQVCGSLRDRHSMSQIYSPHSLSMPKCSFWDVRLSSVKEHCIMANAIYADDYELFICLRSRTGKTFLPTQHFSLLRCHPVNLRALSTQYLSLGKCVRNIYHPLQTEG